MNQLEIFQIPVGEQVLVYAPLLRYAGVFSRGDLDQLLRAINGDEDFIRDSLRQQAQSLITGKAELPQRRSGAVVSPLFLGLVTTRSCNLACRYCDFPPPQGKAQAMSPQLAKSSIDAYLRLLKENAVPAGEIQFFGGEPFLINGLVEFSLSYARQAAWRAGISLQFEVTTNGFFSKKRCHWIADNFDTVVLSLDGPAVIHNQNRPTLHGGESFPVIHENARILSSGNCDLVIRVCVTNESAACLDEIARWIAGQFTVSAVCFEPLTVSDLSRKFGLSPPNPYEFAHYFCRAADFLDQYEIQTVASGTEIDRVQTSFCPVGKDAIIVTPDGQVNACYLLESDWSKEGLDLNFGRVQLDPPGFEFNQAKVDRIREMGFAVNPLCKDCYCKYHCAGACHVNHRSIQKTLEHDDICLHTRLITIRNLLNRISAHDCYRDWLTHLGGRLATSHSSLSATVRSLL